MRYEIVAYNENSVRGKAMTTEQLKEILEAHEKWLNGKEGGEKANLRDADLCGADLRSADLRSADLRNANLRNADLYGADLRGANLRDAELRSAHLRGANLRDAELRSADLCGANLCYADLRGANLRDAELRSANLRNADLRYADLCEADLRNADLRNANLDYSVLPLWRGSLKTHFDDKQIIQFIYHITKAGLYSKNVSTEIKEKLKKLAPLANKFHRVEECGEIHGEKGR